MRKVVWVLPVLLLAGCGGEQVDYAAYSCADFPEQVIEQSQGEYLEVDRMGALDIAVDNRDDFQPPSDGYGMVLRCTGPAVWSFGKKGIVVELIADKSGDTRITWVPNY